MPNKINPTMRDDDVMCDPSDCPSGFWAEGQYWSCAKGGDDLCAPHYRAAARDLKRESDAALAHLDRLDDARAKMAMLIPLGEDIGLVEDDLARVFEKLTRERDEARGHLGAALAQTIDKDDKIIMDHVREAYRLLGGEEL